MNDNDVCKAEGSRVSIMELSGQGLLNLNQLKLFSYLEYLKPSQWAPIGKAICKKKLLLVRRKRY